MCPNAGDGDDQEEETINAFAPSVANRLNAYAPGAGLKAHDIYQLMSICIIETLVFETKSDWCGLFGEDEWEWYEYANDVEKFYKMGCASAHSGFESRSETVANLELNSYGEPLGPVQGVGWTNELLARLTHSHVHDHTQTNHTLTRHKSTFPLNRRFYADFTHENTMVAIFSAMGLFKDGRPLDPLRPDPARAWHARRMVPFSARFVVERMQCGRETKVRLLLNDDVVKGMQCMDEEGLCELGHFVDSQVYARADGAGDWEKCFD